MFSKLSPNYENLKGTKGTKGTKGIMLPLWVWG